MSLHNRTTTIAEEFRPNYFNKWLGFYLFKPCDFWKSKSKKGNVSFAQIKVGDYDGLVIAKGRAREYLGLNQDLMDMTFKFQSLRML